MHFFTLVVMPPGSNHDHDVEAYVDRAMAPFSEHLEVEEVTEDGETYWTNPDSFWDWYQIGGRWTGHLSDYEPENDPRNKQPCRYCGQTGMREYADGNHGSCNVCDGTGIETQWPTQWVRHSGDIARLGDVRGRLEESPPYYIVHEGVSRSERHNPEWDGKFGAESTNPYFIPTTEIVDTLAGLADDCVVVVVDCHS